MGYRGGQSAEERVDYMARYAELMEAFDARRGFGEPLKLLRYAAVGLLTVDAPGAEVVEGVYRHEAALKDALPWYRKLSVSGFIRLALSGALFKFGIGSADFVAAHDDVRGWAGSRHGRALGGVYGMLATLILCIQEETRAPNRAQVERLLDIYGELRGHRWFLTGADDYPACAALTGCEGSAQEIGARAEAMFGILREAAGFRWGDDLQRAANFLALTGLSPDEAGRRASEIAEGLRDRGCTISTGEYDEVAIFCAIPLPAARLCDHVRDCYDRLPGMRRFSDSARHRFDIAASVAVAELLSAGEFSQLETLKSLGDLQAIIAAQQAAAAAAASAAAAS